MALTDGLVSYWKFDGDATDSVGSNNGTVNGASLTTGKINQGYSFDGSNDNIQVPFGTNSFSTSVLSVSYWMKYTDSSNIIHPIFFMSSQSRFNSAYRIYLNNQGDYRILCYPNTSYNKNSAYFSNSNLYDGTWHHIVDVVDYQNGSIQSYVDGVAQTMTQTESSTTSSMNFNSDSAFGGNPFDNNRYLDGSIDEIGIWNRALSSTEVSTLWNSGDGVQYPFSETPSSAQIIKVYGVPIYKMYGA